MTDNTGKPCQHVTQVWNPFQRGYVNICDVTGHEAQGHWAVYHTADGADECFSCSDSRCTATLDEYHDHWD